MLPLYTHENVHQRHQPSLWAIPGSGSGARDGSGGGWAFGPSGSKEQRSASLVRTLRRLLPAVIVLCMMLPLWYLTADLRSSASAEEDAGIGGSSRGAQHHLSRKVLDRDAQLLLPAVPLRRLVLVAGHAVYTGIDYAEAAKESSWFLEAYQQVPGEAQSFLDHIRLGIEQAAADPDALLLFSGGQTRRAAGPRSEGLSYWVVAEAAGWFGHPEVRNRTFTEEHARDSFENLMFSLCRFYELAGHYPEGITVVSYLLKESRFKTLHRLAVRWPEERFKFVGTPVPPEAIGAKEGEARTVAAFKENPYGCKGDLRQKKLGRDPFAVGPIHPSRCPDLKGLLNYCGTTLYEGSVPWQSSP